VLTEQIHVLQISLPSKAKMCFGSSWRLILEAISLTWQAISLERFGFVKRGIHVTAFDCGFGSSEINFMPRTRF